MEAPVWGAARSALERRPARSALSSFLTLPCGGGTFGSLRYVHCAPLLSDNKAGAGAEEQGLPGAVVTWSGDGRRGGGHLA